MSKTRSINAEDKKIYNILVGKLKGKKPLGRPKNRWENLLTKSLKK
jgi:hypothetical protein